MMDCSLYSTILMQIYIQNIRPGFSQFSSEEKLDFLDASLADIYSDPAGIIVDVERERRRMRVKISLETKARRTCDDCLTEFQETFTLKATRIFVIGGDDELAGDTDVITLPADARELDLIPVIREMILLNHPMKVICKPDCNGLCPGCGVNLNVDTCQCKEDGGDPRWDELKKLLK